ncbi:D-alanyl-D-alanine carboxypeptidase family protein [Moraxella marmotae]|uniref:D-alanyl-D-alanine carboxypeptidase family protein n=1 Tax=Moraxella marmotae TaxID=3344520 RepID=UPI0035F25FAA
MSQDFNSIAERAYARHKAAQERNNPQVTNTTPSAEQNRSIWKIAKDFREQHNVPTFQEAKANVKAQNKRTDEIVDTIHKDGISKSNNYNYNQVSGYAFPYRGNMVNPQELLPEQSSVLVEGGKGVIRGVNSVIDGGRTVLEASMELPERAFNSLVRDEAYLAQWEKENAALKETNPTLYEYLKPKFLFEDGQLVLASGNMRKAHQQLSKDIDDTFFGGKTPAWVDLNTYAPSSQTVKEQQRFEETWDKAYQDKGLLSAIYEAGKVAATSPNLLASSLGESAPSIVAGGAFGKAAGSIGYSSNAARTFAGTWGSTSLAAVGDTVQESDGKYTGRDAIFDTAEGLGEALVGHLTPKAAKVYDLERIFAGGTPAAAAVAKSAPNTLVGAYLRNTGKYATGVLGEAVQEFAQEATSSALDDIQKTGSTSLSSAAKSGTLGAVMGATQSNLVGLPSYALANTRDSIVYPVKYLINKHQQRQEEKTNPDSDKYDPVTAFTHASAKEATAKTDEEKAAAQQAKETALQKSNEKVADLMEQIQNASGDEKTKLEQELQQYREQTVSKLNDNYTKQQITQEEQAQQSKYDAWDNFMQVVGLPSYRRIQQNREELAKASEVTVVAGTNAGTGTTNQGSTGGGYNHSMQVTKANNPKVGMQVGIMGSYAAGGEKGKQTGAGSNDHFDISAWDANGKRANPNNYAVRFVRADGVTIADSMKTNPLIPAQKFGAKRGYGGHVGIDIDSRHFAGQPTRGLYINSQYTVTNLEFSKVVTDAPKGKDGKRQGYGNFVDITFNDGVKVRVAHMDADGSNALRQLYAGTKGGTTTVPTTTPTQQASGKFDEAQTVQVGTRKANARYKNDGDGKGNYYEVVGEHGKKIKYYHYNEAPANELKSLNNVFYTNDGKGYRNNSNWKIHQDAYQPLVNMVNAAKKDGIILFPVGNNSTFRSYKMQQQNLANKGTGRSVGNVLQTNAVVGGSRHHTGLTVDFNSVETSYWNSAEGKKVFNWLKTHAGEYGFVMSYPEGNSQGVSTEAWEFYYAGTDRAKQLMTPKGAGGSVAAPIQQASGNVSNHQTRAVPISNYQLVTKDNPAVGIVVGRTKEGPNKYSTTLQLQDGTVIKRTGTVGWALNNSGNILATPNSVKREGVIGTVKVDAKRTFLVFDTKENGDKAKADLIFNSRTYKTQTIDTFTRSYLGVEKGKETNDYGESYKTYSSNVKATMRKKGFGDSTFTKQLKDYNDAERKALTEAISEQEGSNDSRNTTEIVTTGSGYITTDNAGNIDAQVVDNTQNQINQLLAEIEQEENEAKRAKLQQQVDEQQAQLQELQAQLQQSQAQANQVHEPDADTISAAISQADPQQVAQARTQAFHQTLRYAHLLTDDEINDLEKYQILDEKQLETVRHLKKIHDPKLATQVKKEIYIGKKGAKAQDSYIGLKDYITYLQQSIGSEANITDASTFQRYYGFLTNWNESHSNKAITAQRAFQLAQQTGEELIIARNKDNNDWGIYRKGELTDEQRVELGALKIGKYSKALVNGLITEAGHINDVKLAYDDILNHNNMPTVESLSLKSLGVQGETTTILDTIKDVENQHKQAAPQAQPTTDPIINTDTDVAVQNHQTPKYNQQVNDVSVATNTPTTPVDTAPVATNTQEVQGLGNRNETITVTKHRQVGQYVAGNYTSYQSRVNNQNLDNTYWVGRVAKKKEDGSYQYVSMSRYALAYDEKLTNDDGSIKEGVLSTPFNPLDTTATDESSKRRTEIALATNQENYGVLHDGTKQGRTAALTEAANRYMDMLRVAVARNPEYADVLLSLANNDTQIYTDTKKDRNSNIGVINQVLDSLAELQLDSNLPAKQKQQVVSQVLEAMGTMMNDGEFYPSVPRQLPNGQDYTNYLDKEGYTATVHGKEQYQAFVPQYKGASLTETGIGYALDRLNQTNNSDSNSNPQDDVTGVTWSDDENTHWSDDDLSVFDDLVNPNTNPNTNANTNTNPDTLSTGLDNTTDDTGLGDVIADTPAQNDTQVNPVDNPTLPPQSKSYDSFEQMIDELGLDVDNELTQRAGTDYDEYLNRTDTQPNLTLDGITTNADGSQQAQFSINGNPYTAPIKPVAQTNQSTGLDNAVNDTTVNQEQAVADTSTDTNTDTVQAQEQVQSHTDKQVSNTEQAEQTKQQDTGTNQVKATDSVASSTTKSDGTTHKQEQAKQEPVTDKPTAQSATDTATSTTSHTANTAQFEQKVSRNSSIPINRNRNARIKETNLTGLSARINTDKPSNTPVRYKPQWVDKAVKVLDLVETMAEYIAANKDKVSADVLENFALLQTLASHHPNIKVVIYSKNNAPKTRDSKTIYVSQHSNNMIRDVTKQLVQLTIQRVASEMELVHPDDVANAKDALKAIKDGHSTEGNELTSIDDFKHLIKLGELNEQLKQILFAMRQKIRQAQDNEHISDELRTKLIQASTSPTALLSMMMDTDVKAFLKQTPMATDTDTKPSSKSKKGIFNTAYKKLMNNLAKFFGLNPKQQTAYESLLENVGQLTIISVLDDNVSFELEQDAKMTVFKNTTEDERTSELAKPIIITKDDQEKGVSARNVLKAHFDQEQSKHKPLSSIPNYLEKLLLNPVKAALKLGLDIVPDKAQINQLEDFVLFAGQMREYLNQVHNKSNELYEYKSLASYLGQEGAFDTNTLDAISYAIYDYILSYGEQQQNTFDDVFSLLGITDADDRKRISLPPEVYETYRYIGRIQTLEADALGKRIAQTLNIKSVEQGSIELDSRLYSALGNWAIAAMQAADLVHIHSISSKQHLENHIKLQEQLDTKEDNTDNTDNTNAAERAKHNARLNSSISEHGTVRFISFTNINGKQTNQRVNQIVQTKTGTLGFLKQIMGGASATRVPLLKPPRADDVKTKIKRTVAKVTSLQAKRVAKAQQEAMVVNETVWQAMTALAQQHQGKFLLMIGAGYTAEQVDKLHKTKHDSFYSKVEGIQRDWKNALNFIAGITADENGERKFWDKMFMAGNSRMHLNSNVFNIQSSKLHRAIADLDNFKVTIKLQNKDGQSTIQSLQQKLAQQQQKLQPEHLTKDELSLLFFIKAIGENAEGTEDFVKRWVADNYPNIFTEGFTVDKLPAYVFVPALLAYMRQDHAQAGIKAMQQVTAGDSITDTQMDAIKAVVDEMDMQGSSVRALVEFSQLQSALENKDSNLTTSLGLSSDGLNNGAFLAHFWNGTYDATLLNRTGLFLTQSQYENYQQARHDSTLGDYYTGFKDRTVDAQQIAAYKESQLQQAISRAKEKGWNVASVIKRIQAEHQLLDRVISIHDSLYKRSAAKSVLVPFNYGAGLAATARSTFDKFLDDQISFMEDMVKKENKLRQQLHNGEINQYEYNNAYYELLQQIKERHTIYAQMMGKHPNDLVYQHHKDNRRYLVINDNLQISDLLDYWFDDKSLGELQQGYHKTVAHYLNTQLTQYEESYIASRDVNLGMLTDIFDLANATFDELETTAKDNYLEQQAAKYVEQGMSVADAKTQAEKELAYTGLPNAYIQEHIITPWLQLVQPNINTLYSRESDERQGALQIADFKENLISDTADGGENLTSNAFYMINQLGKLQGTSTASPVRRQVLTEFILRANASMTQSLDSYISSYTMSEGKRVNVNIHDANIGAVDNHIQMTQLQNQATYHALLHYQGQLEVLETLVDALVNVQKAVADGKLDKALAFDGAKLSTLQSTYSHVAHVIYTNLATLDKVNKIHQYAGEFGAYTPNQADKDAHAKVTKQTQDRLQAVQDKLDGLRKDSVQESTKVNTPTTSTQLRHESASELLTSYLQSVSDSTNNPDAAMAELLHELISKDDGENDITVIITDEPLTDYDGNPASGRYDTNNHTITIYHDSKVHGDEINQKVLHHEIIHALTEQHILNPTQQSQKHIHTLQGMLRSVLAYYKANQKALDTAYPEAAAYMGLLQSMAKDDKANGTNYALSEFIAYGMTEPVVMRIINAGVGKNVQLSSTGLTARFKAFINSALHMLGLKPEDKGYAGFAQAVYALMTQDRPTDTRSQVQEQLSLFSRVMEETEHQSAKQVYENIQDNSTSSQHNERLNNLWASVYTPFYDALATEHQTAVDKNLNKLFEEADHGLFGLSAKEAHAHLMVSYVLSTLLNAHADTEAVNQIRKIYGQITKNISTVEDLFADYHTVSADVQAIYDKQYKALMSSKADVSANTQIAHVVSLALTSENLRQRLEQALDKKQAENNSWFDKAMNAWYKASHILESKYLGNAQTTTEGLDKMLTKLVQIDVSSRLHHINKLDNAWANTYGAMMNLANKAFDKAADVATDAVIDGLDKTGNHEIAEGFKAYKRVNKVIKNGHDDYDKFADGHNIRYKDGSKFSASQEYSDASNLLFDGYLGFTELIAPPKLKGLVAEVKQVLYELRGNYGIGHVVEHISRLNNKVQQDRVAIKNDVIQVLNKVFKNPQAITDDVKVAITRVLLKTDAQALLDTHSDKDVLRLVTDADYRQKRYDDLYNKLAQYESDPVKLNYLRVSIKKLGYYMATETTVKGMVKDSASIASFTGTRYKTELENVNPDLLAVIDELVSLDSLNYVDAKYMQKVTKLVETESQALLATLRFSQAMVAQSKEEFKHNALSYNKGYVPSILSPYTDVISVTQAEIADKLQEGYELVMDTPMGQDSFDNTDGRYLMVNTEYASQRRVTGALEMKDTHHKGFAVYDYQNDSAELNRVAQQMEQYRWEQANTINAKSYDPRTEAGNNLVAVTDANGLLTHYQYEMTGSTRDMLLSRDMRFDELLGTMNANLAASPEIRALQQELAKQLATDAKDGSQKNSLAYTVLDPNSLDPKMEEIYRLLPYAFRTEMERQFGVGKPILIRSDVFNTVFGFKAYSIAEMFDKAAGERNALETIMTILYKSIYGNKARNKAGSHYEVWTWFAKTAKNMIVIRSVKVLAFNILANMLMLLNQGLSPTQVAKHTFYAWKEGRNYTQLDKQKRQLEVQLLATNPQDKQTIAKLSQQIKVLENQLESSGMHKYMQAGLVSTITEDVDTSTQTKTFKSKFEQTLEDIEDKIPEPAAKVLKVALVHPDTKAYKLLAEATQFSDVAAKYALAKHIEAKALKQGKSKARAFEDGIIAAQEAFINYDLPTSRTLQTMNDLGFVMFSKFSLRFQRALARQLHLNGGQTLAQHYLFEWLTPYPGILSPFAGGIHLGEGALTIFDGIGELPLFQLLR